MKLRPIITAVLASVCAASAAQTASKINLNTSTPAAPLGSINVHFQSDAATPTANISAYATYPTFVVNCGSGYDLEAPLAAALADISTSTGGVIDMRMCTNHGEFDADLTINQSNVTILLPCDTVITTHTIQIYRYVRNIRITGCGYQGGSPTTFNFGGTVWDYRGSTYPFAAGDTNGVYNTVGVEISNMLIITGNAGNGARAIELDDVQEARLENLYLSGSGDYNQSGIVLNGIGNYTGGLFQNIHIDSYGTAIFGTGSGDAGLNASTFNKIHINCPSIVSRGSSATAGFQFNNADGNAVTGGDIENCTWAVYLGSYATANSFIGVRTEGSTYQIMAVSGSNYNLWHAGGTLYTGKVFDEGTHNSFIDVFHRASNNLNGDLWRSQADTTITNHIYTGIGLGTVRGRQDEWITDTPGTANSYQNAWLWGPGDGSTGLQTWVLEDMINSVNRLSIGEYTTAGGNNQTGISSAGTGAVIINGSTNAGTGGVVFGSGGSSPTTVASIDSSGDATLWGYSRFWADSAEQWRFNCASSSACNLDDMNSGTAVHRVRMYTGAGLDLDSEGTAAVTVNNTSTSGTGGFLIYGGGADYHNTLIFEAAESSGVGVYKLPGLASSSGYDCLHVDTDGWLYKMSGDCNIGTGSVTSVGLSMPAGFEISGSPVTTSGTLSATWSYVTPDYFLSGPCGGSAAKASWRVLCATDLPAATTSTQGAVILPTGASSNTLGTAAMSATSDFDASGAASTALSTAETYSANASNLSRGSVSASLLPAATTSTQGAVILPSGASSSTLGPAVKAGNTYGCLDGYDHLPCVVYEMGLTSESAATGSYATAYTTTASGVYRITGNVYATTQASGTLTVTLQCKEAQISGVTSHGLGVGSATIGSTESWNVSPQLVQNIASGVNIQWETVSSGSGTGGVWNIDLIIERVK